MLCCLLSVLLLSCSEDDDIVRHSEKNAIFVYMAADNDLDYFGTALKKCVSPFFSYLWYYMVLHLKMPTTYCKAFITQACIIVM